MSTHDNAYRLKETEAKLEEISILQGVSVDTLVAQVKEFKEVQADMKESLQTKVLQNLIGVVITADKDKDFVIDPEEVDGLVVRLKSMDGVDFSEENFNKAVTKSGYDPSDATKGGYSINVVIEVMRNLLDDDVPDEDNIFTLKTDTIIAGKS